MSTRILQDVPPLDPEELSRIEADFHRDGFRHIPGILTPSEVDALKAGIDRVFAEERWKETDNLYSDWIAVRLFEVDRVFEELLTREPIIGIAERILGANCHLMANNVVRNAPGKAIDRFHVDDALIFPAPSCMDRHDPRLTMPVFVMTVQIPLTDIPSIEYGPTEFVRGSHYAGRSPNDPHAPTFDGHGPEPLFCAAGDIYLHNGQCWHRGAPNTSDRVRYLLQLTYCVRWVSQRFYPFVNYQLPADVLSRADERRKRVLGFHPKGAYG